MIRRSIIAVAAVIALSAAAASTQAFASDEADASVADGSVTQAVVATVSALRR